MLSYSTALKEIYSGGKVLINPNYFQIIYFNLFYHKQMDFILLFVWPNKKSELWQLHSACVQTLVAALK